MARPMDTLVRLYGARPEHSRFALLAVRPTLLGVRQGLSLYEHPLLGDEVGILADDGTTMVQTDLFDLVDFEEDFL